LDEADLEEAVEPGVKKIKDFFSKLAKAKKVEKFIDELEKMQEKGSSSAMGKLFGAIEDGKAKSSLIFDLDDLLGGFEFDESFNEEVTQKLTEVKKKVVVRGGKKQKIDEPCGPGKERVNGVCKRIDPKRLLALKKQAKKTAKKRKGKMAGILRKAKISRNKR